MSRNVALCIGINSYPGVGASLAGCVNDAGDWAEALETRGFVVELLIDELATRQNLLAAMAGVVAAAGPDGTVVITFSGHGSWSPDFGSDEPDRREDVLCPFDLGSAGPILQDDLRSAFARRPGTAKVVTIFDSCHSGALARFATLAPPLPLTRYRFLPPNAFLTGTARERAETLVRRPSRCASDCNALALAAATDADLCWEGTFDGRAGGAYTHCALRALKQLPATATYVDWHRAIRQQLPSAEFPQTPYLRATVQQRAWRLFT